VGFFFEFYPYFSVGFIMALSSRRLRMAEGQMKQFGEMLQGTTFFQTKLLGKSNI